MDTQQINTILFNCCAEFIGTYPSDEIPENHPEKFALVVNTDTKFSGGEHWQSIVGDGDTVYFFDSFGRKPSGKIDQFCRRFSHIYYNKSAHQDISEITCGGFSIFHIFEQCVRGKSFENIVNIFDSIIDDDIFIREWLFLNFYVTI